MVLSPRFLSEYRANYHSLLQCVLSYDIIIMGQRNVCPRSDQLHHRLPYGKCPCHGAMNLGRHNHLTNLEYADDISAIFATHYNDISSALGIFDAEASELGLRTSWANTKIIQFGDVPSPLSLHFCNNDVECVDKFTYIGSIITNTSDLKVLQASLC